MNDDDSTPNLGEIYPDSDVISLAGLRELYDNWKKGYELSNHEKHLVRKYYDIKEQLGHDEDFLQNIRVAAEDMGVELQ